MARVVVSPSATADIAEIVTYLHGQTGRRTADRYRVAFRAVLRRLADHPESGAARPELGRDIRICVVSPYIVVYRLPAGERIVSVLRALHGHRRITSGSL